MVRPFFSTILSARAVPAVNIPAASNHVNFPGLVFHGIFLFYVRQFSLFPCPCSPMPNVTTLLHAASLHLRTSIVSASLHSCRCRLAPRYASCPQRPASRPPKCLSDLRQGSH